MGTEFESIRYAITNQVAVITLNRPNTFNAFTPQMNKEITQALKQAEREETARCIVITGEGKAFCAGENVENVDENTNHAEFLRERYHPMIRALKSTSKPTIAAVNGVAAGAGMSLALATDYRIVKRESKFVSAFMGIGLIPDSGFLYFLPRIIGYAKALEIATLGKPITGEEAISIGLATELVSTNEWEEQVHEFAQQFTTMPTKAFSLIKRYMMNGMHLPFDTVLEQETHAQQIAGMTQDHMEGLVAFKEKRKPEYIGK